jgi:hypothetical protein
MKCNLNYIEIPPHPSQNDFPQWNIATNASQVLGKSSPYKLLFQRSISVESVEISIESPQKTGNIATTDLAVLLLVI